MRDVQEMLKRDNALNKDFYDVMACPYGVKAEIKFFVQAPKGYKGVNNIMRTTAPDIDNLEKAAFDSIFKGLEIKLDGSYKNTAVPTTDPTTVPTVPTTVPTNYPQDLNFAWHGTHWCYSISLHCVIPLRFALRRKSLDEAYKRSRFLKYK